LRCGQLGKKFLAKHARYAKVGETQGDTPSLSLTLRELDVLGERIRTPEKRSLATIATTATSEKL